MLLTAGANASTLLTLEGPLSGQVLGPQSIQAPCIICASNPGSGQPAGMGFNNFHNTGGDSSYDLWSTNNTGTLGDGVHGTSYTVGQLTSIVGAQFVIGVDVNTTSAAAESLLNFEVWDTTNNVLLYNYAGPTTIGGINNNGNGYGDWKLSTVDLTGLSANTGIAFHASWNHASDGGESFFLQGVSAVPEPTTWAMMILGFLGVGVLGMKRSGRKFRFA